MLSGQLNTLCMKLIAEIESSLIYNSDSGVLFGCVSMSWKTCGCYLNYRELISTFQQNILQYASQSEMMLFASELETLTLTVRGPTLVVRIWRL